MTEELTKTEAGPAKAVGDVLDATGVTLRFGGLTSLDNVDLRMGAARSWRSSGRTARARPPCSTR